MCQQLEEGSGTTFHFQATCDAWQRTSLSISVYNRSYLQSKFFKITPIYILEVFLIVKNRLKTLHFFITG